MKTQSSTEPTYPYLQLKPAIADILSEHSLKDLFLCLIDLCDHLKETEFEAGNGVTARQWASLSDCLIRATITADELRS
jgi:hypothetical protein